MKKFKNEELKNLAIALYNVRYSLACDYCTKENCNGKSPREKCIENIINYWRNILELKESMRDTTDTNNANPISEKSELLEFGRAIELLYKLNLKINRENIAFICATKKLSRETKRSLYISVENIPDLPNRKEIRINNISCFFIKLNGGVEEENINSLDVEFWQSLDFTKSSANIIKQIYLHYYDEYLMTPEEENELMVLGDMGISDEFKKLFLEFSKNNEGEKEWD